MSFTYQRGLHCSVFAAVVDLKKAQFLLEGCSKEYVFLEEANQMEVRQDENSFSSPVSSAKGNLFSHVLSLTPVIRNKSKM